MKADINGCSTCPDGTENYEHFRGRVQYDYRHTNGELFSTVEATLQMCRNKRDKWMDKNGY